MELHEAAVQQYIESRKQAWDYGGGLFGPRSRDDYRAAARDLHELVKGRERIAFQIREIGSLLDRIDAFRAETLERHGQMRHVILQHRSLAVGLQERLEFIEQQLRGSSPPRASIFAAA